MAFRRCAAAAASAAFRRCVPRLALAAPLRARPAPSPAVFGAAAQARWQSGLPGDLERRRRGVNELFAEARDEIGAARESVGTTYFMDELDAAKEAVESCLSEYHALLADAGGEDGQRLANEMGAKMSQLEEELQQLRDNPEGDH
eukprot:TRINITY_DN257_c1_g1_i1.p1 TRINITY_DN257_c1_g1~~TRINITY_DN257_c1_g1_i1.p1  ORF type:complete len:145 (+),score=42.79 TRINITY_DN257_c1_g1_i1:103-537(+)